MGAQLHHAHHVLHDAQDFLVILIGERRFRLECAADIELLDLRRAPRHRHGICCRHSFAFF